MGEEGKVDGRLRCSQGAAPVVSKDAIARHRVPR